MAVLDYESISLAPNASEDGGSVEVEIEGLGEGGGRVTEKADL